MKLFMSETIIEGKRRFGRVVGLGFVSLGTLFLAACSTQSPGISRGGPYVKPGLILVTPDQAERHGLVLSTEEKAPRELDYLDSATVIKPSEIKVYSTGRYVDPADPELLHEAHLVYRREAGPAWVMRPGASGRILSGSRCFEAGPAATPLQTQEVEASIAELKKRVKQDRDDLDGLTRVLELMRLKPEGASTSPH